MRLARLFFIVLSSSYFLAAACDGGGSGSAQQVGSSATSKAGSLPDDPNLVDKPDINLIPDEKDIATDEIFYNFAKDDRSITFDDYLNDYDILKVKSEKVRNDDPWRIILSDGDTNYCFSGNVAIDNKYDHIKIGLTGYTSNLSDIICSDKKWDFALWEGFRRGNSLSISLTIETNEGEINRSFEALSPNDVYEIYSWRGVQGIKHNLGGSFSIKKDIVFPDPGEDGLPASGFEPIASGGSGAFLFTYKGPTFIGSLNGEGHKISNFAVNKPNFNYIGLFGSIGNGGNADKIFVQNLIIEINPEIGVVGKNFVGGLAGRINGGKILNVAVKGGAIRGYAVMGGLVGQSIAKVHRSSSTSDLEGHSNIKNAIDNWTPLSAVQLISDIVAGKFSGLVGGLVGSANGEIARSYAKGNVSGEAFVGGLAGSSTDTITQSYARGSVTGFGFIGGLVGGKTGGNIDMSYSTGRVNASSTAANILAGGFLGIDVGNVSNSYYSSNSGFDKAVFGQPGAVHFDVTKITSVPIQISQLSGFGDTIYNPLFPTSDDLSGFIWKWQIGDWPTLIDVP